jgi:hypothetical protein
MFHVEHLKALRCDPKVFHVEQWSDTDRGAEASLAAALPAATSRRSTCSTWNIQKDSTAEHRVFHAEQSIAVDTHQPADYTYR